MKRYILFAGDIYYPIGGWMDFNCSSDDLQELEKKCKSLNEDYGWFQIVDTKTWEIIKE